MKNIITIAFAFISISISAQKKSQMHLIEEFSNPAHPHIHSSTYDKKEERGLRAMTERLIGYRTDNSTQGNWLNNDSVNYSYTGTNGDIDNPDGTCTQTYDFEYVANVLTNYRLRSNTFNTNGQLISYIESFWNGNSWENSSKFSITYTANGLTETYLQQTWSNGWVNEFKTTYQYNSADKLLLNLTQKWMNNAWVNLNRSVYTFDTNNFETSFLQENFTNNTWVSYSKYSTVYNANSDIYQLLYQENLGSGLENVRQTTYSYNGQYQNIGSVTEVWVLSSLWLNQLKYESEYGPNGKRNTSTRYDWDSNTNIWKEKSKDFYGYDANLNTTSLVHDEWINGSWEDKYAYNYTFNSANQKTYEKFLQAVNNSLVNNKQETWVFDANGFLLSRTRDSWVNGAWQPSYTYVYTNTQYGNKSTVLYQSWQNNALENIYRSFYYYEEFENGLSSIKVVPFTETKLFPNPAGSVVNMLFSTYEETPVTMNIFSITGQLMITQTIQSDHGNNRIEVNTKNFERGFYVVQLKSAKAESNLKLTVN